MAQWKSPLAGYENAQPLPTTINPDGKSLYNPPGPLSKAYDEFPKGFNPNKNGFDFHSERLSVHWKRYVTDPVCCMESTICSTAPQNHNMRRSYTNVFAGNFPK